MNKQTSVRRLLALAAAAALAATSLGGCGNYAHRVKDSTYDYGSRQKNDPKTLGSKMYGTMSGLPGQHDNAWFEYSSLLSTDVSGINGVAGALVFLTDKNAYVGLSLDATAVGTRKRGGPGTREQDNGGAGDGVYNNDTGSPYWNNRRMVTPYNSNLSISDHNEISGELKQTVAVHIRRIAPTVQEVHISANMDFVNQLVQYAQEAWSGHSLTPWLDSFNQLVKHQFIGEGSPPESIESQSRRAAERLTDPGKAP